MKAGERIITTCLRGTNPGIDQRHTSDPSGVDPTNICLHPFEDAASGYVEASIRHLVPVLDQSASARCESFTKEALREGFTGGVRWVPLEAAENDSSRQIIRVLTPVARPNVVVEA